MAEPERVQSRAARVYVPLTFAGLAIALAAVSAAPLLQPVGTDVGHGDIRLTAQLPVFFWCLSWPIALARAPDRTGLQFTWALGALLLLVHAAVAFHLGHGWSHAKAWDHTQEASGFGAGVFVNYAFAVVWLVDAAWAGIAFRSYTARPRWLHWGVHGFLAFVVFNAAFVFAGWETRTRFAVFMLMMLAAIGLAKRARPVDAPPAG